MSQSLELMQTNRIASIDELKVGGHQASCASIPTIIAALYFHALGANDKVAGKPHAGPISGASFFDLSKSGHPLADRIVTTSPDVTVSTNLGAFENPLGPVA